MSDAPEPVVQPPNVIALIVVGGGLVAGLEAAAHSEVIPPFWRALCGILAVTGGTIVGALSPGLRRAS